MAPGDVCRVPLAAVRHGRAGQTSESGPCGVVEGSCGYRARGVSIRGNFVLSRNMGYKTWGGRHVAKRSSDPRQAYPDVKFQCDKLVILPLLPLGASYLVAKDRCCHDVAKFR